MESTAIKIEISLMDIRGKVLFNGNWETSVSPTDNEKTILKALKEKKALIIASIAKCNSASQINYLEKLGLCRQLKYSYELGGKRIEKTLTLNT